MKHNLSVNDYRPTAKSLFKPLIDQLLNFDIYSVFSTRNAHLPIGSLVKKYPEPIPEFIIKWLDYSGDSHLVQNIPQPLEHSFQISYAEDDCEGADQQYGVKKIRYEADQRLVETLPEQTIRSISSTNIISLEELKLRCEANYYVKYESFARDFQTLVNWNQLYRGGETVAALWITALSELFNRLAGEAFRQKLASRRSEDVARLMKSELAYKINCSTYPIVPTNFRQYEFIEDYLPTPTERTEIIRNKMRSKKEPVECPQNCSCLSASEGPFCSFSLIQGTWISECQNRANRIECAHSDPEDMRRCRNAEIKMGRGKRCRTDPEQQGLFDIEECLIWGIDYYTRKNIIYSLPDWDVDDFVLIDNSASKSDFVSNLIKAANYNSVVGYDMRKACEYIIQNVAQQAKSTSSHWQYPEPVSQVGRMFVQKDKEYALHLLDVLSLGVDETGFRIHTKGKGARCLNVMGIRQSEFIVEYFGQVYELWRWYERQDHTKRIMRQQKLSNLPDFYNIYLEKHSDEKEGYDMLVVDPISHGNFASRFSHSCHPNCGTITTVSDGKYYIGMYALRDIEIGEELTFDYCSITQSNLEHMQAICLCGTKICRGHYLQLGNAKQMNYVLDEHNCFLGRNSVLLHSTQPLTESDKELLAKHNIKGNLLDDCPEWLKKWAYFIIEFIQFQGVEFKKAELAKLQGVVFKGTEGLSQEEIQSRNQIFAQVKKSDLFNARYQNLITSIDKLKYYLGSIKDFSPPIDFQSSQVVLKALWNVNRPAKKKQPESVIYILMAHLKKTHMARQLSVIEEIDKYVQGEECIKKKLYYVRLGFLLLSQLVRLSSQKSDQLADVLFFYAFTHTYFTTHEYQSLDSQKMIISFKDFLTEPSKLQNQHETCKRQYSSQFVWGQLVAWFKQTIASPQSSLSQDRRGTLSYPTVDSIARTNTYPFEGHTRANFFKSLVEKPFASWPPDQCPWSYKNNSKSYGTVLFQSYFNAEKLKDLNLPGVTDEIPGKQGKKLIRCVAHTVNRPMDQKFELFAQVEGLLAGITLSEVMSHKETFWSEGFQESKGVFPQSLNPPPNPEDKPALKRAKV